MVRIFGSTGSRRRRRYQLAAIVSLVALLGLFVAQPALAVHDEAFQLDGDVSASTPTSYGGHTQTVDWDSLFDANGNKILPLPTGFTAATFHRDFILNSNGSYNTFDGTTYTQGSKDINNISSNWVCAAANNVTDKGDIQNAYAAAYTDPVSGDQKLYFGLERSSNNGDANVAFWFLQDPTADCSTATGTKPWTGNHVDGDILIVSAFTKGGNVSTITAYRWNGGAGGSLGTTPVAGGGDCRASNQALGDPICATANTASISTPWLTNNNGKNTGLGHTLLTGEFFEGGINLTDTNLAGKCFNTFVADTRSSQSLTATLYDFSRGVLGECLSDTKTTPQKGNGDPIPDGGLSIGTGSVTVRDHAEVKVDGVSTFDGNVTFYLCGPLALDSTSNCATGGVQIGSPVSVSNPSPATANSDVTTLTSVGRYCWRAVYSGDASTGVPGSSDPKSATDTSTTECFKVNPVKPTLTTKASCTSTPCVLGVDTLSDTATLTGTANKPGTNGIGPGGTINATNGAPADASISWQLFLPAGNGCTTSVTPTGSPATVSGDSTYGPVTYTPTISDGVGTYTFVASYPGDSPNTLAADSTSCPDTSGTETITVIGSADSASQQRWLPNDRVVLTTTGGTTLNGTLTVTLYPSIDCKGTAVSGQTYTFNPSGDPSGSVYQTTNTTFFVGTNPDGTAGGAAGSYSWLVHYHDNNLTSPADRCETSTVSPITDSP